MSDIEDKHFGFVFDLHHNRNLWSGVQEGQFKNEISQIVLQEAANIQVSISGGI